MILIKESINTLKATKSLYPSFEPDKDCPMWLCQEREYILSLQCEPEIEHQKIAYLQAIEHFECAEWDAIQQFDINWLLISHTINTRLAAQSFITELQASPSETIIQSTMHANTEVSNAHSIVKALEETNSFLNPWMLNSAEWQEAILLCQEREYHHLLNELELHTVSQHFEIKKLGLPKTGESCMFIFTLSLSSYWL